MRADARRCALFLGVMSALVLQSCDTRSRRASARLRTENAHLEQQVDVLSTRVQELEAALATTESDQGLSAGALAMSPLPVQLQIASISGFEPGDSEDRIIAEVHITAHDGLGRPVQLVGPIEVQVLRPVEGGEPVLLGRLDLDPHEVRRAWRQGLVGATYLAQVDLEAADVEPGSFVLTHVFHQDARTDRRLETAGALNRPSADAGDDLP